jgi:hypothetical protein
LTLLSHTPCFLLSRWAVPLYTQQQAILNDHKSGNLRDTQILLWLHFLQTVFSLINCYTLNADFTDCATYRLRLQCRLMHRYLSLPLDNQISNYPQQWLWLIHLWLYIIWIYKIKAFAWLRVHNKRTAYVGYFIFSTEHNSGILMPTIITCVHKYKFCLFTHMNYF